MKFLTTWFVSAVALSIAAALLGDHMAIGTEGSETIERIIAVALVGLVFTVISSFVGPVVKALSLPFIIISLGLALLVINALLLLLTEWITDKLDMSFEIDGFWWAVLASIIISISQTVVGAFMPGDPELR